MKYKTRNTIDFQAATIHVDAANRGYAFSCLSDGNDEPENQHDYAPHCCTVLALTT